MKTHRFFSVFLLLILAVSLLTGPASAVELARNGRFDLIILDVMMPELDGQEACMRIREFSNVPIIMLTAKSEDADKLMGVECGADDYVT